jgi:hypothetical protein
MRIAWSVFWVLACALLILLWVRSYWKSDALCYGGLPRAKSARIIESDLGDLRFSSKFSPDPTDTGRWLFTSKPTATRLRHRYSFAGAGYTPAHYSGLTVPMWMPVILLAGMSFVPWLRFSLRTLLIATTLVAVVLGLQVYVSTK